MEEAYKLGFSGGLNQGKLVAALPGFREIYINKLHAGQFKTPGNPSFLKSF